MNTDIYLLVEHLQGQVAEISYLLAAAGREMAYVTGGRLYGLLFGQDVQSMAQDLDVDQVITAEHPALANFTSEAYLRVLESILKQAEPRIVLFGHTTTGMDVASGISARCGFPIVSQCSRLFAADGKLTFISQICGGKIMAEGALPESTAVITLVPGGYSPDRGRSLQAPEIRAVDPPPLEGLRVSFVAFHEPDTSDVDITKEPLLVAIGRGLQNQGDLELIEELSEALGATICASRPVVDLGWLPATRLVGKSGKKVKPEVYLALGISGAPEHIESVMDSGLIIAVNTDPEAPIFSIAQYGIVADMLDLAEALTDQLQLTKVGPG